MGFRILRCMIFFQVFLLFAWVRRNTWFSMFWLMNGLRKTGDFIFGMSPELLLFGLGTIEAHEVYSQKTLSY